MNRILPLFVTAALALSSIWAGVDSYLRTEATIASDLTRALTLTAQEQPVDWLSTDTIRSFRGHLQMTELRDNAYLSFSLLDERRQRAAGTVASDTLCVGESVQAQGYATCSALSIWWMSDQRLSTLLAVLTLIMGLFSLIEKRASTLNGISEGKTTVNSADALLEQTAPSLPRLEETLDPSRTGRAGGESSCFTPLQTQLLSLLLASPTYELTKQEICDALWPKKDNASETLYTLVHRIKPVLDQHSDLRIVSNRGRSYRLERKH